MLCVLFNIFLTKKKCLAVVMIKDTGSQNSVSSVIMANVSRGFWNYNYKVARIVFETTAKQYKTNYLSIKCRLAKCRRWNDRTIQIRFSKTSYWNWKTYLPDLIKLNSRFSWPRIHMIRKSFLKSALPGKKQVRSLELQFFIHAVRLRCLTEEK